MNSLEEIEYKGYMIKVYQDTEPSDPREWDHQGIMVCFHNRYSLGDKHSFTIEEIKELINRKDVLSLPLYLYDHSGITMNTSGFSCPWDSGQVGVIYVTFEDIKKAYGVKNVTKKIRDKVFKLLQSEVETYDQYLTGDVYGYVIEDSLSAEMLDSCWGFFGGYPKGYDYMIDECKLIVDHAGISKKDLFEQTMGFAV